MGTADNMMMVSNVGPAATKRWFLLVDSINILVIQVFSALAVGGAIVCTVHRTKAELEERANESARQVLFIITPISIVVKVESVWGLRSHYSVDIRVGGS